MDAAHSSEVKLFLRLARNIIQNKKEDLSGFFRENVIDWKLFRDLAVFHELLPFFYQELKDFSAVIPEDFLEILKQNHYGVLIRSQKIWQNFLSLAGVFKRKGLSIVPMKGISGLADIYRERPFRAMADIDVLVKKEELPKVKELLVMLGYQICFGGLKEAYWMEKHCELTFSKNGSAPLDVHFALDFKRSDTVVLSHLWERIRTVSVDGRNVSLLSPEDELFSLALHARRYGGKALCLKNIFDLAMILQKTGNHFDWDYVAREARAGKMCATVFFILLQAKAFFGAAIPEFAWRELRVPRCKREAVRKLIERHAFAPTVSKKSKALYLKTHFLLFDGFWEPICYILGIPLEQFAKYYELKPYALKTRILYNLRLPYFAWRCVFPQSSSTKEFQ